MPDDVERSERQIQRWAGDADVDAIVTTGGTGITGRDVTPEAVEPLFDKKIDGFAVIFHLVSYQSVGLSTLQSRACAGIDRRTLRLLPARLQRGGEGRLGQGHLAQLDSRHGPCNMVEIMPRLSECADERAHPHRRDGPRRAWSTSRPRPRHRPRRAVAAGFVRMDAETLALACRDGTAAKGDVARESPSSPASWPPSAPPT